jgi:hypothetical protein
MELRLKRLAGGEDLLRQVGSALQSGRFPHALTLKGPPGVGHLSHSAAC